ncbi:hypothetical protein RUM43_012985 [Polyplax serrata]|uniref:Uncharacterized protein n=1 Tax=Polyplax serrata TaxID=468196 RepID=A0AAN8P1A5_POLSC
MGKRRRVQVGKRKRKKIEMDESQQSWKVELEARVSSIHLKTFSSRNLSLSPGVSRYHGRKPALSSRAITCTVAKRSVPSGKLTASTEVVPKEEIVKGELVEESSRNEARKLINGKSNCLLSSHDSEEEKPNRRKFTWKSFSVRRGRHMRLKVFSASFDSRIDNGYVCNATEFAAMSPT